jgi:ABC-2 type transport system ATP-binding protein
MNAADSTTPRLERTEGHSVSDSATVCVPQKRKVRTVSPTPEEVPNTGDIPGDELVIDVVRLQKSYGIVEALCGIDLQVARGEVIAFLGPNGAGKTTTLEILEGYRRQTSGLVRVLGVEPYAAGRSWRERIGVVLQVSEPERDLRVAECLALYAGYYPSPRDVDEVLALVGLADLANTLTNRLSGGQRRRLDVGLALIGDPELLFLDEPTTGFDPSARRTAWEMISGLRALGVTVLLTTHYMEEAEQLADRVVVISQGRIVAEGTPATLAGRENASAELLFRLPFATSIEDLPAVVRTAVQSKRGRQLVVRASNPLETLGPLVHWAEVNGFELADLEVRRPSLEDIYLSLIDPRTEVS